MKLRKIYIWILLGAFFVSLGGAGLFFGKQAETQDKIVVFVTVGIDQSKLPNESSSYELQRAAEHFSDVLLGWTLTPSFHEDFAKKTAVHGKEEYLFTGQRQEKQNLLFESTGYKFNEDGSSAEGEDLLAVLNDWIQDYDAKTHAGYVLAIQKTSFDTVDPVSRSMPIAGVVLLSVTLMATLLLAYEYAQTRRRS